MIITGVSQSEAQRPSFDWTQEASLAERALRNKGASDPTGKAEILEKVGYAWYRSSMQSDTSRMFQERIHNSADAYKHAEENYGANRRTAEMLRCRAMVAFLYYWVSPSVVVRKRLLDKTWRATVSSLSKSRRGSDKIGFGITYNRLSLAMGLRLNVEWNLKTRTTMLRQVIALGEEAVNGLTLEKLLEEKARACVITASHLSHLAYFLDSSAREKLYPKCDDYLRRGIESSESTALIELASQSRHSMTYIGGAPASDRGISIIEKSVEYVRETKDRFALAAGLEFLAYNLYLKSSVVDDPQERDKLATRWMNLTIEADECYPPISVGAPRESFFFTSPPYAVHHLLAALASTSEEQRRRELEAARMRVTQQLEQASESRTPAAYYLAHYAGSRVFLFEAQTEKAPALKKRALQRAAEHTKRALTVIPRMAGILNWEKGGLTNTLAEIEHDRARLQTSRGERTRRLIRAIHLKENGLDLRDRVLGQTADAVAPSYNYQARNQLECGDMYVELYALRQEAGDLTRAERRFVAAADLFQKLGQRVRVAEAYWRAAVALEKLTEHVRASEYYDLASNNYNIAGQRIPSLKKFCEDLAFFMQAKSEIEKAKNHHVRREYPLARDCYEKAASFHTSSRVWSYIAPYYSAWASIESAEDYATQVQTEESIQSFEEAIRLFREVARSVQKQIPLIKEETEQASAKRVLDDGENWQKYARARIIVEQARASVRDGDFKSSWSSCEAAKRILDNLFSKLEVNDESRDEVNFLIDMCKACQVISKSEMEASPKSFSEAADFFDAWRKRTPDSHAKMLMTGHSHYYRALQFGSQFSESRETRHYTSARRNCEVATEYYLKAKSAESVEKSRATILLIDGYSYLDKANQTSDPEKQARLYKAAEKLLSESSDTFGKYGFSDRRQHVVHLLEKTVKDREIAASLAVVLASPANVQLPQSPSTIGPTNRADSGPQRFAKAFVETELSTNDSIGLGKVVELRLLIANAGDGPATLLRVEDVIPEGFELEQLPPSTSLDSQNLVLNGRRLSPLKTEELRLVLKPHVNHDVTLQPRLVYLDENGHEYQHNLEPFPIIQRVGTNSVRAILTVRSTEFFLDETFDCAIEISSGSSVVLKSIEDPVPENLEVARCEGGILKDGARRIDFGRLKFGSGQKHLVTLALRARAEGTARLAPSLLLEEKSGSSRREEVGAVEITIFASSPILKFLAEAFAKDDSVKRLSLDQAGWRTLLSVAASLKIPRSQVYGEPRYGHAFGKPIEYLLRSGLIEYRTFPGKGRGGNITKVRVVQERESVQRLVQSLKPSVPMSNAVRQVNAVSISTPK